MRLHEPRWARAARVQLLLALGLAAVARDENEYTNSMRYATATAEAVENSSNRATECILFTASASSGTC